VQTKVANLAGLKFEFVADVVDGDEMDGLARIRFEFLP
jgi:hypothetical protein